MLRLNLFIINKMESFLTPSNITFFIGLVGVIFSVYLYFKNPQIKIEKYLIKERADNDKKDSALAQKVCWEQELNEKKFTDMGNRLTKAMTLAENHTHTVDTKVDKLIESVNSMNVNFTREIGILNTTINERVPKRK